MTNRILINKDIIESVPEHLFDRGRHDANAVNGDTGRGTVVLFRHGDQDLILKSYFRGGLPGRFIKDTYLFTGLERTRMWREFHLLLEMRKLGLPVPQPLAARCEMTTPISYRGDLIMQEIVSAAPLSILIAREPLSDETWTKIGEVIAQFHNNFVCHRDLNASNILLTPAGDVYLVDFDKCYFKRNRQDRARNWAAANLKRLQQSLHKLSTHVRTFHFDNDKWLALRQGYESIASRYVILLWISICI